MYVSSSQHRRKQEVAKVAKKRGVAKQLTSCSNMIEMFSIKVRRGG